MFIKKRWRKSMKPKYFDYLPRYANDLENYIKLPGLKLVEDIKFYRGIIAQKPDVVSFRTRIYAESIVKEIARRNNLNLKESKFKDKTFNVLSNELKQKKLIENSTMKLITQIRLSGNKAAHGDIVNTKDAEQSLINLDCIFRLLIKSEYNQNFNMNPEIFDEIQQSNYETFERKFIYVTSVDNNDGEYPSYVGLEKIGEASVPDDLEADFRPNSEYLQLHAKKRISQYMTTSLLPFQVNWAQLAIDNNKKFFSDRDVHALLKRSGIEPEKNKDGRSSEWFKISVDIAKEAIKAVKEGKEALGILHSDKSNFPTIKFRPEQKEAIKKTREVFKNKDTMLWNAKMRFGKTLSALQVIKEEKFQRVLIMTHRPVVRNGWFDDFSKIFTDNTYIFGSKNKGSSIKNLVNATKPFVYFASIQDLRGSTWAGGKQGDKNREFLTIDWDLIIIDEAHEGNETELANNVQQGLKRESTKILALSGTPFNLMDKYDEDNIFTWDYTMEQEAKVRWSIDKPDEPNPYSGLPRVLMYTFDVTNKFNYLDESKAFNFKEFLRVEHDNPNKLVHEENVIQFLNYITEENSSSNFPFSKEEFRNNLRHTLWLLPGVKETNALELLLSKHEVFKEYKIVNVVRNGDSAYANDADLEKVRNAIGNNPSETKTITLTVRKLTTGVSVPEWTGVFFLSNIESPTSYLQASFRAQTPFNHEKLGVKKNAYIFDFAPDRALKIMSESIGLTSKKGKINTTEQKEKLQNMLNFLPILGQSGNGMKEYSVDTMLTQLKKAYADKAVRTGFEDNSLYNDRLLMLEETDLSKFNNLKGIVGSTNTKKKDFIDINKNGFNQEEYDRGTKAEKKAKKQRTHEEEEAIKKIQELRKQRKSMISILRGVSIRIPMMIYGMDLDIDENVTIDKFIQSVDEKSWEEFMPNGLTKGLFREFTQYYDGEVFIEAGRIIRQKAKSYDKLDFLERTEQIAALFGSFKNPDKETVLTPWRVVNMHLSQTIGGYCYYDEKYENTTIGGSTAMHWVNQKITKDVYKNNTKILDINSKTGLYPLFVATSIYYKKMLEENERTAGKFSPENIWKEVLLNNIYAIAKTPMAKTITQRTLSGYQSYETNIRFIPDLVEKLKSDKYETNNIIKKEFNKMKFDVIVGNPPYQESDGGAQASASPIYQYFVKAGKNLNPKYMTQITPSRWYVGGKGLDDYRNEMLNDIHMRELHDWLTPEDIFPQTNIRGGINYFLWDKDYDNIKDLFHMVTYKDNKVVDDVMRPMKIQNIDIFLRDSRSVDILNKITKHGNNQYLSEFASPLRPFGFRGYFTKDKKFHISSKNLENPVKCYGKNAIGFVNRSEVSVRTEWIDEWKVYTARANNIGTELNDNNLNSFVGEPNSICTETYIVLGANLNLDEKAAENLTKYLKTKFVRYLHSLAKGSQDATAKTYRFVPIQTFTNQSDINWNKDIVEIDEQLFKKYKLSDLEINHITNKITDMIN